MNAQPTTVSSFMSSPVFSIGVDDSLADVEEQLADRDVGALVVAGRDGSPLGVLSRSDLIRVAQGVTHSQGFYTLELPDRCAGEVMSRDLVTTSPDTALWRVARKMAKQRIHRVFVMRGEELVGVVATEDVLRAVADSDLATTLGEAMTEAIVSVEGDDTMRLVAERINAAHKRGLVVLSGGLPVGTISQRDLLIAQRWPSTTRVETWMTPRPLFLPQDMPLPLAASHMLALGVDHALVMSAKGLQGIVTGIDFARCFAHEHAEASASIDE